MDRETELAEMQQMREEVEQALTKGAQEMDIELQRRRIGLVQAREGERGRTAEPALEEGAQVHANSIEVTAGLGEGTRSKQSEFAVDEKRAYGKRSHGNAKTGPPVVTWGQQVTLNGKASGGVGADGVTVKDPTPCTPVALDSFPLPPPMGIVSPSARCMHVFQCTVCRTRVSSCKSAKTGFECVM